MAVRFDADRMGEVLRANHEHYHPFVTSSPEVERSVQPRSANGATHMGMVFHFADCESILFTFWHTTSATGMVISCFIVFLIAVFYEGLKFYRQWLMSQNRLEGGAHRRRSRRSRRSHRHDNMHLEDAMSQSSVMSAVPGGGGPSCGESLRPWFKPMHLFQTVLHMFHVFIAFMLMLIFMTFNVWLCAAVVLGAGLGYFIFFAKTGGLTEHCP